MILSVEMPVKPQGNVQMLVAVFIESGRLLGGKRVCLGRRQRHLSQTPTVVCLSAAVCFGSRPNPSPILDNDGQERTLWARWQARACHR